MHYIIWWVSIQSDLLLLDLQVNTASSVWRTWFTRSTQWGRVSGRPTTSWCPSSCRWLGTQPGIRPGCSRTWGNLDLVVPTSTPSSDYWTERTSWFRGHWAATIRLPFFLRSKYRQESFSFVPLAVRLIRFTQNHTIFMHLFTHSLVTGGWETGSRKPLSPCLCVFVLHLCLKTQSDKGCVECYTLGLHADRLPTSFLCEKV